jgi:hypothetical protein
MVDVNLDCVEINFYYLGSFSTFIYHGFDVFCVNAHLIYRNQDSVKVISSSSTTTWSWMPEIIMVLVLNF